jgi:DNA primase
MTIGRATGEIGANDFTHPTYRAVWELIEAQGGFAAGAGDPERAARVRDAATEPTVAAAVTALAVEPVRTAGSPDSSYVAHHVFRLLELTALRRIADVKSRLQRTNPVDQPAEFNRMFGDLAALEQHRRALRDNIVGDP